MNISKNKNLTILNHFIFNKSQYNVEILWENNKPYFKGSDISKILDIKNIRTSTLNFDADEKVVRIMNSPGGLQETVMLTEVGIYRLLFNSRKPLAKPFQKWVAKLIEEVQNNCIENFENQIKIMNCKHTIEINNLEERLKNAEANNEESIRKSNHETLLRSMNNKRIVYFARIKELDGKILVKIGATKDIKTTFIERHAKDYGEIYVIHALESKTNFDFEQFLLKHKYISQFLYRKPVKKDGGTSIEVILVTEEELQKVLLIADRNIRKYPNSVPDIDDRLDNLENKIDKITDIIINTSAASTTSEDSETIDLDEDPIFEDLKDKSPSSLVVESDIDTESKEETTPSTPSTPSSSTSSPPASSTQKEKPKTKYRPPGTGKCSECDVKISRRAKKCGECYNNGKKIFQVTKEELYELVWVKRVPFTQIGKKFGVSDNAIRKRCRALDIEVRQIKT